MFTRSLPLLSATLALALGSAAMARDLTDMIGRSVTLPDEIATVATHGSVPVINGFVMATGNGDKIASNLPPRFIRSGRWVYQNVFAPQIPDSAQIHDAEGNPDLEAILTLAPDVALTFGRDVADLLEANGIPTVVLRVQTPDEVKATVALLGEMFGNDTIGAEYAAWFDGTLAEVESRLAAAPARPKVLYLSPGNMTQPHLVAEWWITAAGGTSVTNDGRKEETLSLTTEVVLAADPDILIVGEPAHVQQLKDDATLSQMRAVQEGRILVAPMGAHIWANRTVEQPLTVLWAASHFHPDLFPEAELIEKVREFYVNFFKTELSDEQIRAILSGTVGT